MGGQVRDDQNKNKSKKKLKSFNDPGTLLGVEETKMIEHDSLSPLGS